MARTHAHTSAGTLTYDPGRRNGPTPCSHPTLHEAVWATEHPVMICDKCSEEVRHEER